LHLSEVVTSEEVKSKLETFAEWKERTRQTGLYKIGCSLGLGFIALMVFILQDPVDPDLGLTTIAWVVTAISVVLLGFWDVARSKGFEGKMMLLSLLYVPGFAIMWSLPESWNAYGPDEKVSPSAMPPRVKDLPKFERLEW
jgi:hypothetical protein